MAAALDLSALSLGPLVVSGKGAKQAAITAYGAPALWVPEGFRGVAFEPKGFLGMDEATRVNLVLRAGDLEAQLRALDDWAVGAVAAASEEILGKAMTKDQAADRYIPLLKESEKYPATFRLKMNTAGRSATRLWTSEGVRRDAPERWTECAARPLINIRGVWVMGRDFGLLTETSDVQIQELAPTTCPF